MSYLNLAAKSLVRGAATTLGRRLGGYRRRKRVTWKKSSRVTTPRKTRTFRKKIKIKGTGRSVRQLWKAVRALQRTGDPEVSIRDFIPSSLEMENNPEGYVGATISAFTPANNTMLENGNSYRIKSLNQQLTFGMRVSFNSEAGTDYIYPFTACRHVRVMYVLTKDEPLASPSDIFESFSSPTTGSVVFESSGYTLYPQFVQHPGITYRILYDRTYSIVPARATQVNVRIPGTLFYDKGIIQFREEGEDLVQQNNFLSRILIFDSVDNDFIKLPLLNNQNFAIVLKSQMRWKYYDFGTARPNVSRAAVNMTGEQGAGGAPPLGGDTSKTRVSELQEVVTE